MPLAKSGGKRKRETGSFCIKIKQIVFAKPFPLKSIREKAEAIFRCVFRSLVNLNTKRHSGRLPRTISAYFQMNCFRNDICFIFNAKLCLARKKQ